jgi:ERCC4-type nuclease
MCDSREHKKEIARIQKQFDRLGVRYFISKLYVGDYMSLDNPRLVIDRKKDLLELCGNVTQQHERFRDELIRAKEHGIKIVVLCEHGEDIQELTDVLFWTNPRLKEMDWKMVDGQPQKVQK